jgi:hypothetical protein
MANIDALMTSKSEEWYTPPQIIQRVKKVLGGIDIDPCSCAAANEIVGARCFYGKTDDGLSKPWYTNQAGSLVYMNPPYGSTIGKWVNKLALEFSTGHVFEAIALLPARTDTAWMKVLAPHPRCFVHGRLRFSGSANSATFPSVVVYLTRMPEDIADFVGTFGEIGDIYTYVKSWTVPFGRR